MSTLPEQDMDMALNKPVTCGRLGSSYRKDPKMAAKINNNGEYFPVSNKVSTLAKCISQNSTR